MPVSHRKGRSLDRIKQAIDPQPDQPINIGVIDIFDRLVFRRDAGVHKHPGAPPGQCHLAVTATPSQPSEPVLPWIPRAAHPTQELTRASLTGMIRASGSKRCIRVHRILPGARMLPDLGADGTRDTSPGDASPPRRPSATPDAAGLVQDASDSGPGPRRDQPIDPCSAWAGPAPLDAVSLCLV